MSRASDFVVEFKKFAYKGNMVDLAIGFTVGAAFTAIAKSLVDDIIMPLVGFLLGEGGINEMYILLREGSEPGPYATLVDAQAAGALTINLGLFINSIFVFIIVALVMFFVVRAMIRLEHQIDEITGTEMEQAQITERDCPFCLSAIPLGASRCLYCTSEVEPMEPEPSPA